MNASRASAANTRNYLANAKVRKLRLPMNRHAAMRIRALAEEIGRDSNFAHGWIAEAARLLGLNYGTAWAICRESQPSVGTRVIEQVCKKIGCSTSDLME